MFTVQPIQQLPSERRTPYDLRDLVRKFGACLPATVRDSMNKVNLVALHAARAYGFAFNSFAKEKMMHRYVQINLGTQKDSTECSLSAIKLPMTTSPEQSVNRNWLADYQQILSRNSAVLTSEKFDSRNHQLFDMCCIGSLINGAQKGLVEEYYKCWYGTTISDEIITDYVCFDMSLLAPTGVKSSPLVVTNQPIEWPLATTKSLALESDSDTKNAVFSQKSLLQPLVTPGHKSFYFEKPTLYFYANDESFEEAVELALAEKKEELPFNYEWKSFQQVTVSKPAVCFFRFDNRISRSTVEKMVDVNNAFLVLGAFAKTSRATSNEVGEFAGLKYWKTTIANGYDRGEAILEVEPEFVKSLIAQLRKWNLYQK